MMYEFVQSLSPTALNLFVLVVALSPSLIISFASLFAKDEEEIVFTGGTTYIFAGLCIIVWLITIGYSIAV